MVSIYTDGSALKNGDPSSKGSFAYAVIKGDKVVSEFSTMNLVGTTNSRMEGFAVMLALLYIYNSGLSNVTIYSDSQYVVYTVTGKYGRTKNMDIWKNTDLLMKALQGRNVEVKWIRGHSGNKWNEYVDKLCTKEYKNESRHL